MEIELAGRDDLPRIVELSNWAALHTSANFATEPEPLSQWVETWEKTRELHAWLVAREGATILGFAKSGPHKARQAYRWTAEVSVYIDPASHGRGVGTALYGVLLPMLKAQGYVTVLAGITGGHVASERLHQKVGFVRCATFHRAGWKFGAWHDVGYWELALRADGASPDEVKPVAAVFTRRERGERDACAS